MALYICLDCPLFAGVIAVPQLSAEYHLEKVTCGKIFILKMCWQVLKQHNLDHYCLVAKATSGSFLYLVDMLKRVN